MKILMIGTSQETMGGISTVVNAYSEAGLFERNDISYLSTHRDGTAIAKLSAFILAFFRVFKYLFSKEYGIVHLHVSSRMSFCRKAIFLLLGKLFHKKLIFHLHGAEFRIFLDEELSPIARGLAIRLINLSDIVLVLSPSWKMWMAAIVPDTKVLVMENSICPLQNLDALGKPPNVLLFLGRVGKRKGFWDLLEALSALKAKGISFCLKVGGDGEIDEARNKIQALGLQGDIEYVGWVRGEDKLALLGQASVFVLPSYNEGMPMSVLEALSAGVPVVSTTVGGIPEQVTDGEEGYLIEPGDIPALAEVLERLLTSEKLRKDLGDNAARKFNERFSTQVVLPKLEKLYVNLA